MQKALLSNLEREEPEVMLQLLEDDREVILEKVRRSPLPAYVTSDVAQS